MRYSFSAETGRTTLTIITGYFSQPCHSFAPHSARRSRPAATSSRGGSSRFAQAILVVACAALLLAACGPKPNPAAVGLGDADRGKRLIVRNGCGSCHLIPGVQDADGKVGPPLTSIASRTFLAGVLPNTPPNLVRWIKAPQSIVPGNAMPNMELNDHDARDIAAYLETLR